MAKNLSKETRFVSRNLKEGPSECYAICGYSDVVHLNRLNNTARNSSSNSTCIFKRKISGLLWFYV